MRGLLDVNALIALLDPDHIFNAQVKTGCPDCRQRCPHRQRAAAQGRADCDDGKSAHFSPPQS
ncbi:MAG: hypothetical protein LBG60_07600 [Bifidobacteriaceae bacterium]|jgi:hypothetical protein|nr:hypothetical protein [Bifidobacteriaceae bacterium]